VRELAKTSNVAKRNGVGTIKFREKSSGKGWDSIQEQKRRSAFSGIWGRVRSGEEFSSERRVLLPKKSTLRTRGSRIFP